MFDFRVGGSEFSSGIAPDGKDYPNENKFIEIKPGDRIVLEHQGQSKFRLTVTFTENGGRTRVTFRQKFEDEKIYEQVKSFCPESNEQNLNRLGAVLEGQSV